MARLRTDFWVQAYILRLNQAAINAYVRQHGDDGAGTILVKVSTLDGAAHVMRRQYDFERDELIWEQTDLGDEPMIEAQIIREMQRDRDLWVIEIEDAKGRHLLFEPGL